MTLCHTQHLKEARLWPGYTRVYNVWFITGQDLVIFEPIAPATLIHGGGDACLTASALSEPVQLFSQAACIGLFGPYHVGQLERCISSSATLVWYEANWSSAIWTATCFRVAVTRYTFHGSPC